MEMDANYYNSYNAQAVQQQEQPQIYNQHNHGAGDGSMRLDGLAGSNLHNRRMSNQQTSQLKENLANQSMNMPRGQDASMAGQQDMGHYQGGNGLGNGTPMAPYDYDAMNQAMMSLGQNFHPQAGQPLGPGQGLSIMNAYAPQGGYEMSPTTNFGSPQGTEASMSMNSQMYQNMDTVGYNQGYQQLSTPMYNTMQPDMMQMAVPQQNVATKSGEGTARHQSSYGEGQQNNSRRQSDEHSRRNSIALQKQIQSQGQNQNHNEIQNQLQGQIQSQTPIQNQTQGEAAVDQARANHQLQSQGGQVADNPVVAGQIYNNQFGTRPPQAKPPLSVSYSNAYSSTGFDMLGVLMRVATRKNPQVNFGAVDLSCAFVVCDAHEHDFPIVYCSENFERLTGYTKHEILGRNCRFLQAPDGKVQAGVKRTYVDDDTVLHLKNMITTRSEVQVSLINYRKGGQPFMNLLTMIPVLWDNDEVRFFVGFQVDLVEQPNSVTNKNPDGTFAVNYQRGLQMPRYVPQPSTKPQQSLESAQTVSRDDVSEVLRAMANGEPESSKGLLDRTLLENSDDVVFVLSLKGLFLYLSPSCARILQYEPNELLGTALSAACHPSDIVPVTRELKDTTASRSVDVVFRIRRKQHGYMWFEGRGSLHTEQGKGRKSIILVGRERPVYTLSKSDILASGGIGENEIWSKLSTSGMFLFVGNTTRQLLDRSPEELIGTSMHALMRSDSKVDFARILAIAKTGKRASVKHELINKRGNVMQAFSTLYPGDAIEGQKPTFIVAQTRLIKYSRPSGSHARSSTAVPKLERMSSGPAIDDGTPNSMALSRTGSFTFNASPHPSSNASGQSLTSQQQLMSTFETAATYSGQHGLQLGHQDVALASEENLFEELKTTRSTSWQFELRQMEKHNRILAEELQALLAARKKRKRRKQGAVEKDCANCHTRTTPEWRRGPSGNRDLCNSCGLRWAKQQGRISPRTHKSAPSNASGGESASPGGGKGQANAANEANSQSIGGTLAGADKAKRRASTGSNGGPSAKTANSNVAADKREQIENTNSSNKAIKTEASQGSEDDSRLKSSSADPDADDADGDSGDEDRGSDAGDDLDDDARSPLRHSGNPQTGSGLPHEVTENAAGEEAAEQAHAHDTTDWTATDFDMDLI